MDLRVSLTVCQEIMKTTAEIRGAKPRKYKSRQPVCRNGQIDDENKF